jgi:hypothetical protein
LDGRCDRSCLPFAARRQRSSDTSQLSIRNNPSLPSTITHICRIIPSIELAITNDSRYTHVQSTKNTNRPCRNRTTLCREQLSKPRNQQSLIQSPGVIEKKYKRLHKDFRICQNHRVYRTRRTNISVTANGESISGLKLKELNVLKGNDNQRCLQTEGI